MKKCQYCAEEIKDEAIVCPHCRHDLRSGRPKAYQVLATGGSLTLLFTGLVALMRLAIVAWVRPSRRQV